MRTGLGVLLAAALVATASTGAQGPPPGQAGAGGRGGAAARPRAGTGLILGRVVDAASDRPLPGSVVSLAGAGVTPDRVRVGADGRFVFRDLPDGELMLTATHAGYLEGSPGQRTPAAPARPVELAPGERIGDVTIRLWKFGVVTGAVEDEHGEPVAGLTVHLAQRILMGGRSRLGPGPYPTAVTDDRGRYRFGSVRPGEYIVAVTVGEEFLMRSLMSLVGDPALLAAIAARAASGVQPDELFAPDASMPVFQAAFFRAGTRPSEATALKVGAGDERFDVNLTVRHQPAARVAGTLTDQGAPVGGVRVTLLIPDEGGTGFQVATAFTGPAGQFGMNVAAGRYLLHVYDTVRAPAAGARGAGAPPASAGRGGPPPLERMAWAAVPVDAGTPEATRLVVPVGSGAAIRGRWEFDGAGPVPLVERLPQMLFEVVAVDPARPAFPPLRARLEVDGTFATAGLPPGRYLLRPPSTPGWMPRSAMAGEVDALDVALAVDTADVTGVILTFTSRPPAAVSGFVRTARGEPDRTAFVVAFPADPRLRADLVPQARRVKLARTTREGAFSIPGLPPGDYLVAAGEDDLAERWLDPAMLSALEPRATRVTLVEGDRRELTLRSGRTP